MSLPAVAAAEAFGADVLLEKIDVATTYVHAPGTSTKDVHNRYRDGNNYCDWCGEPIPFTGRRRHCSDRCTDTDLRDAKRAGDIDRYERLQRSIANREWRRAKEAGA